MCHLITDIWRDILNSDMDRGWSAFFQKNCKLGETETHCLHLCWYDATPTHSEKQNRIFKQTRNTTIFSFGYQCCTLKRSGPLCQKSHFLVVTVELIWLFLLNILSLNFLQKPNKSLRLRKFRRSYVHRSVVVQTNHCQISTAFLLDGRCAKWPHSFFSFFCGCLSPTIVHLRNLFLLLKCCQLQGG